MGVPRGIRVICSPLVFLRAAEIGGAGAGDVHSTCVQLKLGHDRMLLQSAVAASDLERAISTKGLIGVPSTLRSYYDLIMTLIHFSRVLL